MNLEMPSFSTPSPELPNPENALEQPELKELPEKFDALIVLGGGFRKNLASDAKEFPQRHLSLESKIRAIGAAEMYLEGKIGVIIITGGLTGKGKGENLPSEAMAMKNFILEKYPQIPENAIILEDKAVDTPNNAVGVEKIISNKELYGIEHYALLTSSTHMDRANRVFEANGLEADLFPAEAYAKERADTIKGTIPIDISGEIQEDPTEFKSNEHYQRLMDRYAHSPRVLMQKVMENFYQMLITLKVINPRGGGLSEKITRGVREQ
jgi:uncharacterized SAM-binding protein YcdF (DUF218 family)